MLQCYNMQSRLIYPRVFIRVFRICRKVESDEDANTIREQKSARQEIALERALKNHLKNEKLTRIEIVF
jgi:hypothetical protein